MPEVHLKENWRRYPSCYQTSWRSMRTSDRGGRDWDGRDTNSLAADAASSASERVERTERTESGGGKKSKMQPNYLNVTSDDLCRIRDKLSGKKSSLVKTYKREIQKQIARSTNCTSRRRSMWRLWRYFLQNLKGYVRKRKRLKTSSMGLRRVPETYPTAWIAALGLRKLMHAPRRT